MLYIILYVNGLKFNLLLYCIEGWCCYDEQSCDERWKRASILMSSKQWPDTRTGRTLRVYLLYIKSK